MSEAPQPMKSRKGLRALFIPAGLFTGLGTELPVFALVMLLVRD